MVVNPVESRQFQRKDGTWVKEVTVKAKDMKTGMTAGEMMDVLLQVPGDIIPRLVVRVMGQVRQITFQVEMVPDAE